VDEEFFDAPECEDWDEMAPRVRAMIDALRALADRMERQLENQISEGDQ
jgi:hypothetical protein